MNYTEPLVSIVVPSYNHSNFIEQCIVSIVTQNYKNYELFVIDDGSTDESLNILKNLQKQYDFYLESNSNQGLAKTLNRGFRELAKGKYLTFCASDDYWLPEKLIRQVKFMEENPEYAMVFGKALHIWENGNINEEATKLRGLHLKGGMIFNELFLGKFHPPVNYLFRASVLTEEGFYRENIWAEDFDMNLRIAIKYKIGYIDSFISAYRLPSDNNKILNFHTIYSHLDTINQFKSHPSYKKALKNWYYRCFLWYSSYRIGKFLAFKGMINNFDKFFTIEFMIFLKNLIIKWK